MADSGETVCSLEEGRLSEGEMHTSRMTAGPGVRLRTLLIHHHAPAHQGDGAIWVQSFIGRWIEELSRYFDRIGLLLHETAEKLPRQDARICAQNVILHSLGPPVGRSRYERNRRIARVCREVSAQYEGLLIRGVTPRQMLVFRSCIVPIRAFLLVGSIVDSKSALGFTEQGLFNWLMYRVRMGELRSIARSQSAMLANSPQVVDELREQFGVPAAFVPTNAISLSQFVPLHFRGFRPRPEILFCGRVVKDKGIEELIEALGLLRKQGVDCLLRVVGSVTPPYRAQLEQLARAHAVDGQVRFEGFVAFGDALLSYFRQADLFVLPSWHEGFPHSLWEAAASCTPVVVTPVGGIPGLVSEREVLFVEPKNAASIAAGIRQVLDNPEGAKQRMTSAYELARFFTVERCAEKLAEQIRGHNEEV